MGSPSRPPSTPPRRTRRGTSSSWPTYRAASPPVREERTPIMLCYPCAEQGTDRPAVALCRSCNAGLCLGHLRATAAHFASSHMLDSCHHDTWTATERPPHADLSSRP